MKKIISFVLIFCFIILGVINSYAIMWISVPSTNDWICLDDNSKVIKNQYYGYDMDKDGVNEYYYFNNKGIMLKNTVTPDGKRVNENGCMIDENGQIVKQQNSSSVYVPETKAINKPQVETVNTGNTSNVIVANENTTSKAKIKKELKENITKKSGVDFIDTKKINGKNWVNTIRFNGNDSYIKANCGEYNELSFEAGIAQLSENGTYLLTVYVNGQTLGEYDEEYFNTDEKITCNFDPNSEIMIVYSSVAEDGMYLSTESKYLYLRNANFATSN